MNDIQKEAKQETNATTANQTQGKSALAVVSLVVGIIALLLSLVPIINNFAFVLVVIGVVFGVIGIVGTGAGKKGGRGLAIAGLVVSLVAGVAVLGSQALYGAAIDSASEALDKSIEESSKSLDKISGNATEDILGTDVDVTIGQFQAVDGDYGMVDTSLPVTVKNLLDESKSYNIQLEAVDASGNRLDTGYVTTSKLGAGQTQEFEAFTYVPSEKLDAFKAATFNIVSVSEY